MGASWDSTGQVAGGAFAEALPSGAALEADPPATVPGRGGSATAAGAGLGLAGGAGHGAECGSWRVRSGWGCLEDHGRAWWLRGAVSGELGPVGAGGMGLRAVAGVAGVAGARGHA